MGISPYKKIIGTFITVQGTPTEAKEKGKDNTGASHHCT